MKRLAGLALAATMLPLGAQAGEAGDAVVAHLYAGTASAGLSAANEACSTADSEACYGLGLLTLVTTYEGLSQDLYRYGATVPSNAAFELLMGGGGGSGPAPANLQPEKLTYDALRGVFDRFLSGLDDARDAFERAGEAGDYVITIDPLKVRIDFNGDGKVDEGETLAALLSQFDDNTFPPPAPTGKTKSKTPDEPLLTTVGFDRADALWFAGYTQIVAAPIDLLLAHDFSNFYNAYLHRVFPLSGLPMGEFNTAGDLFLGAETDASIADLIAGIHTLSFPVTDQARLAGVLDRLKAITDLSRQNWDAILAETDDNRELVPSPRQTSILPGHSVSQQTVDAWMATLDTIDEVLDGKLLVPHWRFAKGVDLKAYFDTAKQTDLVLLISGSAILPYLKDGPIADAQSFAKANEAFGADWLNYVFWFN
ncbi:hypothetical protein WH87_16230 [Devosia epidermidihirudinis]|uniref:EF-hand domain-containing protein n=1 Tax=Devosia epidermidihirudinis TaxID=1293439 RepID=A0A0F5Q4R3_9HYPH|nr:hypothetical protein [Devosia epidermidihirudinis]KKC35596.1 hypothetical protein WH87_16230 [Devosia epidermidihirudinis]